MKITRLQAQNFKSFDSIDVELGNLNVFIGANASGKSNILSILTFLRDIARDGLEEAVSQGGGPELVQNVQLSDSKPTDFQTWIDWSDTQSVQNIKDLSFRVDNTHYQLTLRRQKPDGFEIKKDQITSTLDLLNQNSDLPDDVGNTLVVGRENGHLNIEQGASLLEISGAAAYDHSGLQVGVPLLATSFFPIAFFAETKDLTSLPIFDFHPSDLGTGSPIAGPARLKEDGSNLASVLRKHLTQNVEQRRTFLNLARALLPFADDVEVQTFPGNTLLLFLQESHAEDTYLPASALSDGTLKVFAILVALYFEDRSIVTFEEPASNLHPKLISRLMQMMREASEKKQIFLTTHNPEVIKHVDLDNIYLVSRDEDGFSQITKPNDSEVVGHFLENELGIDDLFVDDLLSL